LNSAWIPAGSTVSHGLLHGHDPLAVLLEDDPVELGLCVGDAPVVGERVRVERVADARDARLALGILAGGCELGRLQPGDRRGDRRLPLGRVEPLAFRGREDEVEHAALLLGELRLDQVGGPLRVRPGDLELVLEAAAERADEHDERGDDGHPGADDAPGMGRARPRPASERAGRESFVCG